MQRIVIVLENGLVSNVFTTGDTEIMIADKDIEGLDPEDTFDIPGIGETYTTLETSEKDADLIKLAFELYNNK